MIETLQNNQHNVLILWKHFLKFIAVYIKQKENSVFSTGGLASWKLALGTKAGFDSG